MARCNFSLVLSIVYRRTDHQDVVRRSGHHRRCSRQFAQPSGIPHQGRCVPSSPSKRSKYSQTVLRVLSRPFREHHRNDSGIRLAWTSLIHPTDPTPQQRNGGPNLVCDGTVNDNSGCGTLEWSRASYGEYFDSQGGGVFATKWDENEITACAHERIEKIRDIWISCFVIQGHSIVLQFRRTFLRARRIHLDGVRRPQSWCRLTVTR